MQLLKFKQGIDIESAAGGECHKQAEAVWAETQASLAKQSGISTEEIDTDDVPQLEGPVIDVNGGDGAKFDGVD